MTDNPILRPSRLAFAAAAALMLACACVDSVQGPVDAPIDESHDARATLSPELLPALVVSNPLASRPDSGAGLSFNEVSSNEQIVFVSLPPGSVPNGETVVARTRGTQAQATSPMVDGGFDPVPIAASSGDTLEIRIELAGGRTPLLFHSVVPPSIPPVIVRTDPPPMKHDVPLNVFMRVVFSEPIDPVTVASGVQLHVGGVEVEVSTRQLPGQPWIVEVVPTVTLEPGTTYDLLITNDIRDLNGEPLEEPVTSTFTTGEQGGQLPVRADWRLAGPGSPYFFYSWDGGHAQRVTVTWISAPTPVIVWDIVHTSGDGIQKLGSGWDAVMHWGPDVPEGATAIVEAQPLKRGERYRVSVTLMDGRSGSVVFTDDRYGWPFTWF